MSDASPFGGSSLLDLFKMEAETHCAALSDGLLALEKTPADPTLIEPLMRAAHSIKGAARIVGLDALVPLAHAMEDCFLAAKSGGDPLTSPRVDQLLKGVDLIGEVRTLAEAGFPEWLKSNAERIGALAAQLRAPSPKAAASAPPPTPPAATPPSPKPAEGPAPPGGPAGGGASSGTVRVAASVLNRMLFLAGESSVEASRLQSRGGLLVGLKARERSLSVAIEELAETLTKERDAIGNRDSSSRASLDAVVAAASGVQSEIVERSSRLDDALRRMEELSGAMYTEVMRSRMRPFSEGTSGFPRMVRDIAKELEKQVSLQVEGGSVQVDRDILQQLESPLTHMLRNSLDHGIETPSEREAAGKARSATITLSARHQGGMLAIEVRDDGRGIDPEAIRRKVVERGMVDKATADRLTRAELMEMLFLPGFSTKQAVTQLSGRGVGLDVVQSMVQGVSGTVTLESELGQGARFMLRLPVTRSVIRAALVHIGGELFAWPLARLDRIALVPESQTLTVQGRMQFQLEESSIGLILATDVLGSARTIDKTEPLPVVVIGKGNDRCGLIVDDVCGEEDLVVRPLDPRLGLVPHIAAAAVRSDGTPVLVVDVDDLWRSVKRSLQEGRPLGVSAGSGSDAGAARRRVLVVDDSITVREVERQLLHRRGYDVEVAVDGKDGYRMLHSGRFDLMVTDVDMPRMTGIELIRAVRAEPKYSTLPIIIVSYKDREEDRLLGLEAGASAYLTKSSFQDDSLIRMIEDLIGAPT